MKPMNVVSPVYGHGVVQNGLWQEHALTVDSDERFFWLRARQFWQPQPTKAAGSRLRFFHKIAALRIGRLFHEWIVAFHRHNLPCTMLCPVEH